MFYHQTNFKIGVYMNNLIIKTRGNSLSKNKPKIYISYHQNDLKKLDEII